MGTEKNNRRKISFWSTFPGCLTGIAALITAIGGLLTALHTLGIIDFNSLKPTIYSAQPFAGSWQGYDPADDSAIVVSLTQTGNELEGTFSDTFSTQSDGTKIRPGFWGVGEGITTSDTEANMTFDLTRSDGFTILFKTRLVLSNRNNTMTIVVKSPPSSSIILERR